MNSNDYYKEMLEKGNEFDDFVCDKLLSEGIIIQSFKSKENNYRGENRLGLEIKYDMMMSKTGNVYMETHEKKKDRPGSYVRSGIYRNDNSWLFGIGDKTVFYIFAKKQLQQLDQSSVDYIIRPQPKPTSKGFLLPVNHAERLAIKVIHF